MIILLYLSYLVSISWLALHVDNVHAPASIILETIALSSSIMSFISEANTMSFETTDSSSSVTMYRPVSPTLSTTVEGEFSR